MVNKLKKALLAPDKKETNNISTNEDIATLLANLFFENK